jgi:hypothetical protein
MNDVPFAAVFQAVSAFSNIVIRLAVDLVTATWESVGAGHRHTPHWPAREDIRWQPVEPEVVCRSRAAADERTRRAKERHWALAQHQKYRPVERQELARRLALSKR